MRRTQVLGQPFGRLVHCRVGTKTITGCGHFDRQPTERRVCVQTSPNQKLFHNSSHQHQDLRRFLEEVSFTGSQYLKASFTLYDKLVS